MTSDNSIKALSNTYLAACIVRLSEQLKAKGRYAYYRTHDPEDPTVRLSYQRAMAEWNRRVLENHNRKRG